MIRAPYNFVPLNEEVYTPPGSNLISHDLPFSDGESGCITIKLTAASPVYVRNGGDWREDNVQLNTNPGYQSFSRFDSCYFIPGTSIKGMIRNVLEAMSFGKMGKGRVTNRPYSYRDLSNSTDGEEYRKKLANKAKAGWLRQDPDGSWRLTPCKFTRVHFDELHRYYKKKTKTTINLKAKKSQSEYKNSADKYNEWNISRQVTFDFLPGDSVVSLDGTTHQGTLVFTGQPSGNKKKEFVFYAPDETSFDVTHLKKDFIAIHSNSNGLANVELSFWLDSGRLESVGIPVFYLGDKYKMHSMGLAMMYRLPFDNRVCDLLPQAHNRKEVHDLADTMFGTIGGEPLKGRIQFSHAFAEADSAIPMTEPVTRVLGGPKASYAPTYLQEGGTYRRKYPAAKLSGRKRFPVHQTDSTEIKGKGGTDKTNTTFRPLKKGAKFICKIRFHNLRRPELGALLSALTFHGNEDSLYHSLGMAKALGCGKMKLEITDIRSTTLCLDNRREYLQSFVESLEDEMHTMESTFNWPSQPQIVELLTMAREQENRDNSTLEHMILEINGDNEFLDAKTKREHLKPYSELDNIKRVTLVSVDDLEAIIATALGKNDIRQILDMQPQDEIFHQALKNALLSQGTPNKSWNDLYNKVQYEPEIVLLRAPETKPKELKIRIGKIQNPDKTRKSIQDLFDYLIAKEIVIPGDIPGWAQPIAYGWADLNLTDGQLLDEVDENNLVNRRWPTVEALKTYLETIHKFADQTDKALCLDAVKDFLDHKENQ